MKHVFFIAVMLLVLGRNAYADSQAVVGFWASNNSIFEISTVDGTLIGEVRALLNPAYLPDENTDRTGQPRTDDNNPDEALRARPLLGLSMFSEYAYEDDLWQGEIYDPESGNTYQSRMKLNRDGNLEIRGYIGMPMFGRTVEFIPMARCTEEIVQMLLQLDVESPCGN
jgi:uncharacterized protein (DUF2147 family)